MDDLEIKIAITYKVPKRGLTLNVRIPTIPATDSEGRRPRSERSDAGHDLCT